MYHQLNITILSTRREKTGQRTLRNLRTGHLAAAAASAAASAAAVAASAAARAACPKVSDGARHAARGCDQLIIILWLCTNK